MTPGLDDVRILHRDGHLLVVAKPVGIATTAPDGGPSLVGLVAQLDPRAPQLHPLSRLDTQVSGIVAFARTAEANHAVLAARRACTFGRRYVALALRVPEPSEGRWTFPVAIDPRDPKRRVALLPGQRGMGVKEAATMYRIRTQVGPVAALDLWPETGRTHQLRVHAARAGLPLLGDVTYGGDKRVTLPNGRILTAPRVMLHCAELRVPALLPGVGPLTLTLPPPEDMRGLLRSAGGDPAALDSGAEPLPPEDSPAGSR